MTTAGNDTRQGNFDSGNGKPENPVFTGETRPLQIVLVVDFKGLFHLKEQAQHRAR